MTSILVSNKTRSDSQTGSEVPISPLPGPSQNRVSITYTIGLNPGPTGLPVPYIKPPRPTGSSSQPWDGPADIRVGSSSSQFYTIILALDPSSAYDCEFRYPTSSKKGDGITLASNDEYPIDPTNPRYLNLQHTVTGTGTNARCKSLSFDFNYLAAGEPHSDPYNLYIRIYYYGRNGTPLSPVMIRFDPDIKNPGDYGLLGSHAGAKKSKKSKSSKRSRNSRKSKR